jgi:hypothetical protein
VPPTQAPATRPDESGIFDLSDVDGPAALALSGTIVFVVLGILYSVRPGSETTKTRTGETTPHRGRRADGRGRRSQTGPVRVTPEA